MSKRSTKIAKVGSQKTTTLRKRQAENSTEKDGDLAVKPVNPYVDFTLGFTFIVLCFYLLNTLSSQSDYYMLGFFFSSLVIVAIGINVVGYCSNYIALFISSLRTGPNIPKDCRNPMKSKLLLRKFSDQAWQLTCHTSMTLFEVYLLFIHQDDNGNTSARWWTDPGTCFQPCAVEFVKGRLKRPLVLNQFYLFQLAIWV